MCNFVAFNFGFHVHEKAMLLVTIPLGLTILKSKEVKKVLRFKLLKLVMMWTLLPLIYTPRETFLKHAIFALDVVLTDYFLPNTPEENKPLNEAATTISGKSPWTFFYEWVYPLTKLFILLVQVAQVVIVEFVVQDTAKKEYLMYRYTECLPVVASLINQCIFLEMTYDSLLK